MGQLKLQSEQRLVCKSIQPEVKCLALGLLDKNFSRWQQFLFFDFFFFQKIGFVTFVVSLIVPHLSFLWCLGRAVLHDSGISMSIFTYIFDILCKLSPMKTICMKCQTLFFFYFFIYLFLFWGWGGGGIEGKGVCLRAEDNINLSAKFALCGFSQWSFEKGLTGSSPMGHIKWNSVFKHAQKMQIRSFCICT